MTYKEWIITDANTNITNPIYCSGFGTSTNYLLVPNLSKEIIESSIPLYNYYYLYSTDSSVIANTKK